MGIRINWPANPENDIASYVLERADDLLSSPWAAVATVVSDITGPAYDPASSTFFFLDPTGDATKFYRLTAIDAVGQFSAPSTPFQPQVTAPAFPSTVVVSHNFGYPGCLRYQTAGGVPVEAAIIRIYKKIDFDLGLVENPVAITLTDAKGNWVNPVSLQTGFTYVVQFAKDGLYGPDKTEVTV